MNSLLLTRGNRYAVTQTFRSLTVPGKKKNHTESHYSDLEIFKTFKTNVKTGTIIKCKFNRKNARSYEMHL